MRWYTLPGWPARVNGHAAAMPTLTRAPGSWEQYKDGTYGYPGAATPAAAGATAQGPTTIGSKAFGIVTGGEASHPLGFWASAGGGALALGLLIFIWWSLPR